MTIQGASNMKVIQISVFLENKKGRLADVTKVLADNNINIRALFIADTSDFGILRMIVDKPKKAFEVLKNNAFTVRENDVVAVEVKDSPGGLAEVLAILSEADMNVEYLYCFVDDKIDAAIDIMRVADVDTTIQVLQKAGVRLISPENLHEV
jgi:hypothetical protein